MRALRHNGDGTARRLRAHAGPELGVLDHDVNLGVENLRFDDSREVVRTRSEVKRSRKEDSER
jgi:hypothetical protein